MTQRYLQPNNNNTQWFVRANTIIGNSNENITIAPDNSNNVGVVIDCSSYLQVPAGVSNERPDISNSYVGMMRYLTTENILEYFNGQTNTWIPISLPAPTITSITPNYISFDSSGQETNSNTYTLTGSNFNNVPGGISVEVIGNNGAGTILLPDSNSASSETSATFTFDPSGTEQLIGISNELPFAVKLTNLNSGFSSTLNNAIIATNAGPEFTQPSVFTPFSFQTFAVQDPCASFLVSGNDLSTTKHYPLDFSFVSGTAGGFNTGGVSDISKNGPLTDSSSSTVKVPAGIRLSATASSYNFTMRVTDFSSAISDANYTLTLADPIITSIDPSLVNINYLPFPFDISVNGDYFIRDTNVVLHNQSTGISAEFTDISYNSTTSLTINDLSSNAGKGVYDICVNNYISPYQSFTNILTITDKFLFTQTGGTVTYLDTVSGPATTISEATASTTSTSSVLITYTSGSGTFVPSSSNNSNFSNVKTQFLVVGGGGGGGASAWTTSGATGGGGGAGEVIEGYMELTNGTTYNISVGNGGTGIGANQSQNSTNGGNSSFSTYTAVGGGYGATTNNGATNPGGNGGSGGGGAYFGQLSTRSGSSTATYYGNSGGTSSVTSFGAGGGGGAFEIGGNATTSLGGAGGDGIEFAINGTNTYYGGGGGGGAFNFNGGSGGQGGGGAGGANAVSGGTGNAGTVNTGGGGGGGTYTNGTHYGGGNGGSGIVILRFPYLINLSFTNLNILNITSTTGVYDVTYVDSGNNVVFYPKENGYTVVTFKINNGASNGSFTFSPNNNLSSNVEYLIIAGGGSGGGGVGDQVGSGGGGAGGYILGINSSGPLTGEQSGGPSTADSPISLSSLVTYSVTVGKGGTGPSGNTVGQNGSNSILSGSDISTITATGGGGGSDSGGSATPGQNGGSGGGAGAYTTAGSGTSLQGNNGGQTTGTIAGGGGGGGAGAAGQGASGGAGPTPGIGGPGGNGLQSAIEGGPTKKYRAGGGGGGSYTTVNPNYRGGTGGLGGGGNGGIAYPAQVNEGMNGAANTGSGGGGVSLGGSNTNSDTGGNGGSGVIILRFPSFA